MRPVWSIVALLAGCSDLPLADTGGSTTTSTTADDPTATGAPPTTSTTGTTSGDETTAEPTCDPALRACTGGQAWLRAFPVTGNNPFGDPIEAAALAVAPNGDIIATGLFGGTIQFGDQSIPSIGALDVWVARFAPDGAPKWFRRFGGPDPTPSEGYVGANWSDGNIAFDTDGDILVTAKCIDTIDFGFGPLVGEDLDPVVLRLTSDGEPEWAQRHVGLGSEYPLFIAPAGDGRLWLAGTLYGPGVDLGGGVLYSDGWGDVLLAQLDADGNHLWSRRAGDPGRQEVRAIAATADGGLVIAGDLEGSLNLGDGLLVSAGTSDAFVARLDSNGEATWSHRYGDNYPQSSRAVRVDGDGGVTLAGYFRSTIDLGGGPFISPKSDDVFQTWSYAWFFARLTADGSHVWSSALPVWADSFDRGDDGTLVITGWSATELMFPNGVSGSGGGPWVATLGPDASPRWQRILSDNEYDVARAVAGPNGAAIVAVTIQGEVEFDGVAVGAPDRDTLVLAQFGL
jgi:hypothetical protein